ncbi:dockerin type I domain-containing protein [Mucisphaera calidilacus]|uniref:Glycoside hydrolase family 5 domain-containing protein n=1 Tax=Mucisphaera calidilacus TaxID=2527982 RepID=A0A518BTK4_9BACT|nr:dockerin type I domain-containing protein [Mucisphaera calidilacus]QDU70299.1 hypothetical protein Pan265_01220 [Mucisphaera calidilacus]
MNTRRTLVITLLALAPAAQADTFHGINAGAPLWNNQIIFTEQRAADIAATGTNAIRINFRLDGHATWDASLLTKYDIIIDTAVNAGFEILGIWSNETTTGTQAQWNQTSGRFDTTPNAYAQSFADNAAFLADRYADQIKRWEVWNEPDAWAQPPSVVGADNAGGTYLDPRRFAELLSETYRQLDDYNGNSLLDQHGIELVTGGLLAHDIGGSFTTGRLYMQGVYSHGVWNSFRNDFDQDYAWDYLGWHFYISPGSTLSPGYLQTYLNDIRAGQLAAGDATPIVVTEFGWNTIGTDGEFAATNLATAYDVLEANDYIDSTYWYQWTDEPAGDWGLLNIHGTETKPAYDVFVEYNLEPLEGDYNGDGLLDASDIDILISHFGEPAWDLTGNGLTNRLDLEFWVENILGTAVGDANLDHAVDLLDLSALASRFNQNGTWAQGDFNGDGIVNLNDLSTLAARFGYTTPVPEPAACLLLTLAGLATRR